MNEYDRVRKTLKIKQDISTAVDDLLNENHLLKKEIENLNKYRVNAVKQELIIQIREEKGFRILKARCPLSPAGAKDLAFQLKDQFDDLYLVLGTLDNNKPGITIAVGKKLLADEKFNAGSIIRQVSKHIQGGGGGQPFFAQAGGKNPNGLDAAMDEAVEMVL